MKTVWLNAIGVFEAVAMLLIVSGFVYTYRTGNPICQALVGATPTCNAVEYQQSVNESTEK